MKTTTLLEKAKSTAMRSGGQNRFYNEEMAEAALGWVRGEVSLSQITRALGIKAQAGGTSYTAVAYGLMYAIHNHMIRPE